MRFIILLIIFVQFFHCNKLEQQEAEELAKAFDSFEQYKQYFESQDQFKKEIKELFGELKEEIKEEKEKRKGKTLIDEVEEQYPQAESELDEVYEKYNDDLAKFANENQNQIYQEKEQIDAIFDNGLNDEFADVQNKLSQEQKMYQETRNSINEYLAKDYTQGEGKKLIEEQVKNTKDDIKEELPEALEEYYQIEEQAEDLFNQTIDQLKGKHAGDKEVMSDIEQISNSQVVENIENMDEFINEELDDFAVDPYLEDPEAKGYQEKAKEMIKEELQNYDEFQEMKLKKARKIIKKLKKKWNKKSNKKKLLENKKLFDQWFEETMQSFQDPEAEKQKYNEVKQMLNKKLKKVKRKIEKKAKKKGCPIKEKQLLNKLDKKLKKVTEDEIDNNIDQYIKVFNEVKVGNFENVPYLSDFSDLSDPKASNKVKFLGEIIKKFKKSR